MKRVLSIAAMFCLGAFGAARGSVHVTPYFRVVNGAGEVPAGLFGVHSTPLTPEMMADWGIESVRMIEGKPLGIPVVRGGGKLTPPGLKQIVECFYDRYQPAKVLVDPQWKAHLVALATTYGANARKSGFAQTVEFWNEPYLNWASKPGVNYDGAYYNPGPEGSPMTIKGWDKPLDSLVWSKELVAVDGTTGKVNYLASGYAKALILKGQLKEGSPYLFRGTPLTMLTRPWGRDPGQPKWISGPQNSEFYRWMFIPFAKALKEADPDVTLVGGWDFNISQDDWAYWPILFKPLIDEGIPWLDGINEHHYGGDSRQVAGSYEVVCAYAETAFGKRLHCYNTEAGGLLDPERPDAGGAPAWTGTSIAQQTGAASYFLRDVTHLIDVCPDKAAARAAHEANLNPGNEIAFKFLKELRGSLVRVESTEPRVWGVASVSGTRLCVVIFNDNRESKNVPVSIDAPAGTEFTGGTRTVIATGTDSALGLVAEPVTAAGKLFSEQVAIGSKIGVKWVFALSAPPDPAAGAAIAETEHYAPGVINRLSAGKPVSLTVEIPAAALKGMSGAELKIVQENWNPQCVCKLNGQVVSLTVDNSWTHVQRIDPGLLKEKNQLVFESASKGQTNIDMAAIVTSAPRGKE